MTAVVALGGLYEEGKGVPQDDSKAMELYLQASAEIPNAAYKLACFYKDGRGGPQNYSKALEWYLKAANQEYPEAEYDIGLLYANGEGVPQDYIKAAEWFDKAANHGDAEAAYMLGNLHEKYLTTSPDYVQAAKWYHKAIELGYDGEIDQLEMIEKRILTRVVKKYIANHPVVNKGKDGFSEKSLRQIKSFFDIPGNEEVLLAHDDTFFKSGKNGFVLTNRGIYARPIMEKTVFTDWATFRDVRISKTFGGEVLADKRSLGCYTDADPAKKIMFKFWIDLQKLLRGIEI